MKKDNFRNKLYFNLDESIEKITKDLTDEINKRILLQENLEKRIYLKCELTGILKLRNNIIDFLRQE